MKINDAQQRLNKLPKTQSGYILILTIVLLAALLGISLNFLQRTSDSLQITGYNRQSSESLLLAENALNMLYGQFMYDATLDDDNIPDNDEAILLNDQDELPVQYLYYTVNSDNEVQSMPSILQKVANGEADGTSATISNHAVDSNILKLLVSDLYTNKASPIIYTLNQNNNKYEVSTKSWSELENSNDGVAAAWMELVKNDQLAGSFQIYVQAVGKVGTSRSYVQRIYGYVQTTLGANLKPLIESNPGGTNEPSN